MRVRVHVHKPTCAHEWIPARVHKYIGALCRLAQVCARIGHMERGSHPGPGSLLTSPSSIQSPLYFFLQLLLLGQESPHYLRTC